MKTITIAICDDDKMALTVISGAVRSIFENNGIAPQIKLYSSPVKLREELDTVMPQLIMLDIQLPQMDGIAFVKQIRKLGNRADVIFVSSREERVFECFEVSPFGFVRKSNFLKDLLDVLNRYVASRQGQTDSQIIDLPTRSNGRVHIPVAEILYFEGNGMYQLLFLRDGKQEVVASRMDHLEDALGEHGFMRIHKGFLVNYRYITRLDKSEATLVNGTAVPISRRKSKDIRQQYLQRGKDQGIMLF